MAYLERFIENFNKLTYNSQCDYIRNRLLLLDLYEIQFIMFFKKLQVLFNDLPSHIKKISEDNKKYIYNFDGILADDNGYFSITRGFIHITYKKLTSNVYSVNIPIKNSKLYLRTYIDTSLSYFLKNIFIHITMEAQIETTYITNTLSYLHLLPKDEQLNELKSILAYIK